MSEPVSNSEIEDVLSSIRRLVSEEPVKKPEAPQDEAVERLVLTPAFRVAERDDEPGAGDEEIAAAPEESVPEESAPEESAPEEAESQEAASLADEPEDVPEPVAEAASAEPEAAPEAEPEHSPVEGHMPAQLPPEFESSDEWSDEKLQSSDGDEPSAGDRQDHAGHEGREIRLVLGGHSAEPATTEDAGAGVTAEADEAADAPQDAALGADPAPSGGTLESRIAELEAAIQRAPQEWEPDGSEEGDDDETRPLNADLELGRLPDFHGEETRGDEPRVEEAHGDEAAMDGHAPQEGDSPEPEAHAGNEAGEDPAPAEESPQAGEWAEESAHQPQDESWQAAEPEPVEWEDVEPEPASNEAAAPEESVESFAEWQDETAGAEPDTAESHDHGDEQSEAHQDNEQPDSPAASDAAEDDESENILIEDETTIDEEALRAIVSDLVREELQGVLGERITRNVRRLVRREIQRALAMRDLE